MGKVRTQGPSVKVSIRSRGAVRVTVQVQPENKPQLLRFGHGNAKLDSAVFTFSLPAGHSCPFAGECHSKADENTGRIKDGARTSFRCYAASMEARHGSVRRSRWRNLRLLRSCKSTEEMAALILRSLSPFAGIVRIHDSGDFFSLPYLDAWLMVARQRPFTRFYFYTKSLRYWLARLDQVGNGHTPGALPNVIPTASWGGRDDALIEKHGLRSARVVLSDTEAEALGLEIDHDDTHAMQHGADFALLIHGMQPAGTPAAKAIAALRSQGEYGYGQKADAARAHRLSLPVLV